MRRRLITTAAASAAVMLLTAPALAHDGHGPLPDGFRAEIGEIVDAQERPVHLPDVRFAVEPGGIGLTVTNTGDRLLEVRGEQAGEPVVRVTADEAFVNERSPQAADVRGATVDPAAAAELIDLVWNRVEPSWVDLPEGGTVFLLDHRGAPGHAPVRSEHATGDVAGRWSVPFTYDGEDHTMLGRIVAVETTASGFWPPWAGPAGLVAAGAAAVASLWLVARRRRAPLPAAAPAPEADDRVLEGAAR